MHFFWLQTRKVTNISWKGFRGGSLAIVFPVLGSQDLLDTINNNFLFMVVSAVSAGNGVSTELSVAAMALVVNNGVLSVYHWGDIPWRELLMGASFR